MSLALSGKSTRNGATFSVYQTLEDAAEFIKSISDRFFHAKVRNFGKLVYNQPSHPLPYFFHGVHISGSEGFFQMFSAQNFAEFGSKGISFRYFPIKIFTYYPPLFTRGLCGLLKFRQQCLFNSFNTHKAIDMECRIRGEGIIVEDGFYFVF